MLAILLWILRLPTSFLGLVYYDDGETLYHTLSLLSGQIPYRDDVSHHFLGYVLPFVLAAKISSFSLDLVREVAFFTQLATALGVFLSMRLLVGFWSSLLAAAVALSIRQPWVWGFYQQYEINFFTAFVVYFSLRYCLERRNSCLAIASLLAGLAFTIDQRALALLFIPCCALVLQSFKLARTVRLGLLALVFGFAPYALALGYLAQHAALESFWEQTFYFPSHFRSASLGIGAILHSWLIIHFDLIQDSSIACVTALVGYVAVVRDHAKWTKDGVDNAAYARAWKLVLCTSLPLILMPLFGTRYFPYYVVTWYPYIGMLSVMSARLFRNLPRHWVRVIAAAPLLAVLVPLCLVMREWKDGKLTPADGDGRKEVVEFLAQQMQKEDTIYVWAYRLDIYAELQRLAAYPYANRIMFHPDPLITSREARALHIYPKYEEHFLRLLNSSPPTYIVTFDRSGSVAQPSVANDRVLELLKTDYSSVYTIEKKDFLGAATRYEVFRRTQ